MKIIKFFSRSKMMDCFKKKNRKSLPDKIDKKEIFANEDDSEFDKFKLSDFELKTLIGEGFIGKLFI
jgi:hypothetical protein